MLLKSIILLMAVVFPFSLLNAEDFIQLKNGKLFGGKIVAESQTAITLQVLAEYLTFERSEIEKVYQRANTIDDQWRERTKRAKADAAKAKDKSDDKKTTPTPAREEKQPLPEQGEGQQERPVQKVSDSTV